MHTTAMSDHVVGLLQSGLSHTEFVLLSVLTFMIGNRDCCKELSRDDVMRASGIKDRRQFYKARNGLKEKSLIQVERCNNKAARGGVCRYEIMHPEIPGRTLPSKGAVDYEHLPDWVVWQFYRRLIPEENHIEGLPLMFDCPLQPHAGTGTFTINLQRGGGPHGFYQCKECMEGQKTFDLTVPEGSPKKTGVKSIRGASGGMQWFYMTLLKIPPYKDHLAQINVRGIIHQIMQEYDEYVAKHREEPRVPRYVLMPEGFVRPPEVMGNGETSF